MALRPGLQLRPPPPVRNDGQVAVYRHADLGPLVTAAVLSDPRHRHLSVVSDTRHARTCEEGHRHMVAR
eukprot:11173-Eustigmatos_ZCMA.PRE.1